MIFERASLSLPCFLFPPMRAFYLPMMMWGDGDRPRWSGPKDTDKENTMSKIFTAAALERYSVPELRTLFRQAQQNLAATDADTADRANALASLENISRAIAKRTASTPAI